MYARASRDSPDVENHPWSWMKEPVAAATRNPRSMPTRIVPTAVRTMLGIQPMRTLSTYEVYSPQGWEGFIQRVSALQRRTRAGPRARGPRSLRAALAHPGRARRRVTAVA